ncbi:LytS/YhcK type 5TM receptor domain-containing protein [Clostridium neonatale]|uniref:LytS/YhcK type 5TM receptor domain-containing protein n=1 Tax=Clostridium neonatale TaxID=137838 RepID=UPI00291C2651|nr:LytS/YhcK type 5TM receptor domain-containing protein [Clostridium neonatale]CAI3198265.1 Two-component sensor histidine kinase [Clostridium neonatale]
MLDLLFEFLGRITLLLICIFLLTRVYILKNVFAKKSHSKKDKIIISIIFSLLAIFATYTGIKIDGSLINARIITIVAGGVLFGPIVGITTGIISGIHRYLIDMNGISSIPCLISSILAGFISGYVYKKADRSLQWIAAIATGMLSETVTMILIILISKPHSIGFNIVSKIGIPMIIGNISVGFIIQIIQSIEDEKEKLAARHAKLSLDIANEALPYFRNINTDSLNKVCSIIKENIEADAVAITDKKNILAYVGVGKEYYKIGHEIITQVAKDAIENNEIIIKNHGFPSRTRILKSAIILPLHDKKDVIGCLKISYIKENKITEPLINLSTGLAEIISTLMEIAKLEDIKKMADKSELKALQTQINPHFLFNALNAIASSIRINPQKARELIINLSSYLRYNLELNDEFIDINDELQQVRNYIEIEKARFGDKINVVCGVDDVNVKIPSLIIQPLVENAIVHGILKNKGKGTIKVIVKKHQEDVQIIIMDDGIGINEEIIQNMYNDEVPKENIGLYNVNSRLKLIYGQGLTITRLNKGTKIEFFVREVKQ